MEPPPFPRVERLGFVSALDGLRGVAIALVMLYHADLLAGGYVGVDVFFVLSGFLIKSLLLEEQDLRGRISLKGFYSRRARRILPALIAVLSNIWPPWGLPVGQASVPSRWAASSPETLSRHSPGRIHWRTMGSVSAISYPLQKKSSSIFCGRSH